MAITLTLGWAHPWSRRRLLRALAAALVMAALAWTGWWFSRPVVTMTPLCTVDGDADCYNVATTPDCQHFVATTLAPDRHLITLWVNGQPWPAPRRLDYAMVAMTPDGHWSAAAEDRAATGRSRWLVVADGQLVGPFAELASYGDRPSRWIKATTANWTVTMLDGRQPGPPCHKLFWLCVSAAPDQRHCVYVAQRADDLAVVADQVVIQTIPGGKLTDYQWYANTTGRLSARFSTDQRHVYVLHDPPSPDRGSKTMTLWRDGVQLAEYPTICDLTESADGQHLAFATFAHHQLDANAATRREGRVVLDGTPLPAADYHAGLCYIPGTHRLAYRGSTGRDAAAQQSYLVVDGQRVPKSEGCVDFACNPQGDRLAWWCERVAGGQSLMVDGQEVAQADSFAHFTFAPQGGHWAVTAEHRDHCDLLVDGVKVASAARFEGFTFAPQGGRWAVDALQGDHHELLVDGQLWPQSRQPNSVRDDGYHKFSDDGQHMAHVRVQATTVGWLPDAFYRRLQYGRGGFLDRWTFLENWRRRAAEQSVLSVDGRDVLAKAPDDISGYDGSHFTFAPTGFHWACFMPGEGARDRVIYDGVPGPPFEHVWLSVPPGPPRDALAFTADNTVTYLAYRDHTFYRVTHRPRW